MESQRDEVFRTNDRTRRNKDKKEKGKSSVRLVSFQISQIYKKFLKLDNYYRRFVTNFVKIVRLLYELIKK